MDLQRRTSGVEFRIAFEIMSEVDVHSFCSFKCGQADAHGAERSSAASPTAAATACEGSTGGTDYVAFSLQDVIYLKF